MKVLPLEIEKSGFGYKQVHRDGMFAVYSQHQGGLRGRIIAYEVIVIQSHNGYTIGGVEIAAAETYPSTASWGKQGWTISMQSPDAKQIALDRTNQVKQAHDMKVKKAESPAIPDDLNPSNP